MSSNINKTPSLPAGEDWGEGAQATTNEVGNIAIRVNSLSKRYEIYDTPRDRLKQFVVPRLQRLAGQSPKQYFREFWALKGVSLEIKKGETVGIIGRNGSGKSTLLQMICGTLTPTSGSIQTNGRIAALLELGSGFNPEFTGRENVYMNAAVLGLSKKEIDARFDDIIAFADIGDFIEQPIKNYSSGMALRLAFAVVVHVDADILVIDEALAVGDIAFQVKCFNFMKKLKQSGVTFLFVSHDINTLRNISDEVIWINAGKIRLSGDRVLVVDEYIKSQHLEINKDLSSVSVSNNTKTGYGNGLAKIADVNVMDVEKNQTRKIISGENYKITFNVEFYEDIENVAFGFSLKNNAGQRVIGLHSSNQKSATFKCIKNKNYTFQIDFENILNQGIYQLQLNVERVFATNQVHEFLDVLEDALVLESIQDIGPDKIFHSLVWSNCEFKIDKA